MYESNQLIKFEIATPEKVILKEMIKQVVVPTIEGEVTILPKHMPLVGILKPGVLEIKNEKDEQRVFSVSGGFVEVLRNKVIILADTAERAEEIDTQKAEEARKRAQESIKELRDTDKERYSNILGKIEKELARTRAVKRWRNIKKI